MKPSDTVQVPTQIEIVSPQQPDRKELEQFVQTSFRQAWGAEVHEFMPSLLGLRNDLGELMGVLGLRSAEAEPLFLERYLDQPVEQLLAAKSGCHIARSEIVELGNLAVTRGGGRNWLITAMTAYLHAAGAGWVVFTAGPILRNAFRRLDLPLLELGPAPPERLGNEAVRWGRYYEQNPTVMAGRVAYGFERLNPRLSTECTLHSLWHAAGRMGGLRAA
jgi:hypothetical protein